MTAVNFPDRLPRRGSGRPSTFTGVQPIRSATVLLFHSVIIGGARARDRAHRHTEWTSTFAQTRRSGSRAFFRSLARVDCTHRRQAIPERHAAIGVRLRALRVVDTEADSSRLVRAAQPDAFVVVVGRLGGTARQGQGQGQGHGWRRESAALVDTAGDGPAAARRLSAVWRVAARATSCKGQRADDGVVFGRVRCDALVSENSAAVLDQGAVASQ